MHTALCHKHIRIPTKKETNSGAPRYAFLVGLRGVFSKDVGTETLDRTSHGFGKIFEGDFADPLAKFSPLMSWGRVGLN